MKSFIVYDSEGFILRTGSCVDSDLEMQAGDNEFVMEGIADDLIHMIIDGKVCNQPEPDQPTDAELILIVQANVRARRNQRLLKSDWTQFSDSPLSDSKKEEWATYRQELRDITETYPDATSIDDIIWPTKPE